MLTLNTDCNGEKQAMAPTFRMSVNIDHRMPCSFGTTRARPENMYQPITAMLTEAHVGFLFRAPDNVKAKFPQFNAVESDAELMKLVKDAMS